MDKQPKKSDPIQQNKSFMLGKLAVQKGLLDSQAVEKCLPIQKDLVGKGVNSELGTIFIRQGLLSPEQVDDLVQVQVYAEISREDILFGRIAVANGILGPEDVEAAAEEQRKHFKETREIKRIGDILVATQKLSEANKQRILATQARLRRLKVVCGCGYVFKAGSEKPPKCPQCQAAFPPSPEIAKIVLPASTSPQTGNRKLLFAAGGLGITLVLVLGVFLLHRPSGQEISHTPTSQTAKESATKETKPPDNDRVVEYFNEAVVAWNQIITSDETASLAEIKKIKHNFYMAHLFGRNGSERDKGIAEKARFILDSGDFSEVWEDSVDLELSDKMGDVYEARNRGDYGLADELLDGLPDEITETSKSKARIEAARKEIQECKRIEEEVERFTKLGMPILSELESGYELSRKLNKGGSTVPAVERLAAWLKKQDHLAFEVCEKYFQALDGNDKAGITRYNQIIQLIGANTTGYLVNRVNERVKTKAVDREELEAAYDLYRRFIDRPNAEAQMALMKWFPKQDHLTESVIEKFVEVIKKKDEILIDKYREIFLLIEGDYKKYLAKRGIKPEDEVPGEFEREISISTGTGFFVASGYILTNYHVVKTAETVIINWGARELVGKVVAKDQIIDLALISASESTLSLDYY